MDDETPRLNDLKRWQAQYAGKGTPWHTDRVHPYLLKYTDRLLENKSDAHIFLPLCGKVKDIKWLAERGHHVVGIEGSSTALEEFFKEQSIKHSVRDVNLDGYTCSVYESEDRRIQLYCADFFECVSKLGLSFDMVWDAQSLVALSSQDRKRYVDIMLHSGILKADAIYLLESYDYDTKYYTYGPNYISDEEIEELFHVGSLIKSTRLEYEDYRLFPFEEGPGAKLRLHMFTFLRDDV